MTGMSITRRLLVMATIFSATAPFILAPAGSQPEKLSNAQPDWDARSQAFIIEFSATSSLANRAVDEGYVLDTTLVISDRSGAMVATLHDTQPVMRLGRPEASRGMVPLQPQAVEWPDPTAGTFRIQATTVLTTDQREAVQVFGYNGAKNSYRISVGVVEPE
jgi:hypothetical protein